SLPEGAYAPDYPSTHAFAPGSVDGYSIGFTYPVVNTVPLAVMLIAWPDDGPTPPYVTGYNGLRPNRDTTFTRSDFIGIGMTGTIRYRVWAIYNDSFGHEDDNLGSYPIQLDSILSSLIDDGFCEDPW